MNPEESKQSPQQQEKSVIKEKVLEEELKKEKILRQQLQNRVQYQQHQLYKQAHPRNSFTQGVSETSKISSKFTFTLIVSQVSPQNDGHIHVTAGYKLMGYVLMKVKTEKPFYMSALSLSLRKVETVLLGDADGRTKKKVLQSMMFPVSQHFKDAPNQPCEKGFYSWPQGNYKFPFSVDTTTEYLPTYLFKQTEPYFEIAERSYYLDIHYRKSVSDNEPWQRCHRTPIHIHQYRKQPEIVAYAQSQKHVASKTSKFMLKKGTVGTSITLLEPKTVYFMCFHSLPLRFEVDNQSNFSIKKISLRFCQDLYYRTSYKGNGLLMKSFTLWTRDLSIQLGLPLEKGTLRSVEKIIIPLDHPNIAPTSVKAQKSLFFFYHYIELVISTPKQVSDISLKLPVTICEPPIEHLAQAIYNRTMSKNRPQQVKPDRGNTQD